MFICIPSEKVAQFRRDLKSKKLDIAELINMSTEERTAIFTKFAGEDAKLVNTLFEEKLVLKNRLQGIKNWASKVGQLGRYDPAQKAKLDTLASQFVAKQQERIFNPKETEAFLADLVEERFGTKISKEEAENVFKLASKTDELKGAFDGKVWTSEEARLNYGAAKVVYQKYTNALKAGDTSVKGLANSLLERTKLTWGENKPKAIFDLLWGATKEISDTSISVVAAWDNSFAGRQGLKTLQTHPTVWWKMVKSSFSDIAKTLRGGGEEAQDILFTDIYSRPNFINGNYATAKLIPKFEEQFPVSWPEKVPVLGRVFKASQIAFEGSAVRARTGLFDIVANTAERNGVDMTDKYQIQSIGRMINSLTARGQLGTRETPAVLRLLFWAPRMIKGNIDVLTMHAGQDISSFARKQAAINLLKIIAETAIIMRIVNAIKPGTCELDPRSSNFGKIKIGNTRFDITGGAASLITLAARLITNSSKSSTTGILSKYGTAYGQQSRFDAIIDFSTGKTAPGARVVVDLLQGRTFKGEKPTLKTELKSLLIPISIQNLFELGDDASASAIAGVFADIMGISANTYAGMDIDWELNTGKTLTEFKLKVGIKKFKEANDLFNKEYNDWFNTIQITPKFQALSDDDKQKVITSKRADIQKSILARF